METTPSESALPQAPTERDRPPITQIESSWNPRESAQSAARHSSLPPPSRPLPRLHSPLDLAASPRDNGSYAKEGATIAAPGRRPSLVGASHDSPVLALPPSYRGERRVTKLRPLAKDRSGPVAALRGSRWIDADVTWLFDARRFTRPASRAPSPGPDSKDASPNLVRK